MLKSIQIFSFVLLGSVLVISSRAQSQTVSVTNRLNLARPDEIISIKLKDLGNAIPQNKIAQISVVEQNKKEYLLAQLVDNDQDGKADELLFRASIGPGETKIFNLETTLNPNFKKPDTSLTTFSRQVTERQNDYAWENDRIAFRSYGTANPSAAVKSLPGGSIDAFFKRVSYPVINKWYKNNAEKEGAYHIDTGEGHDPYVVGESRGLGGTGIWEKDSLYVSSNYNRSKTIAVGPLRTIFELSYAPWDANGRMIDETKRISLDLGSHLNKITETVRSNKPVPNIVTGIFLHDKKGEVNVNQKEGWFRYWEPINDSWLGTAIVADPSIVIDYKDYRTAAKDQSHLFVFTKPVNNQSTFYVGYAWQKSGHFKSAAEWEKYLSDFSKKLASPLEVQIKK